MPRVTGGTVARARRKKYLKAAKGYFGSKHRLFKTAKEQVNHSSVYAYRDRKKTKGNIRKLWIVRINAACRENEISYSKFMNGLKLANIDMNRKMLSEIAIVEPKTFSNLVKISKEALLKPKKEEKIEIIKNEKEVIKKTIVKKAVKKEEVVKKPIAKKVIKKEEVVKKPTIKKTVKKNIEKK